MLPCDRLLNADKQLLQHVDSVICSADASIWKDMYGAMQSCCEVQQHQLLNGAGEAKACTYLCRLYAEVL